MIQDANGKRYSLASAEIEFNGYKVMGASGVKLTQKLEPGEVEGNDSVIVGTTRGKFSGTAGCSVPYIEFEGMVDNLGQSYGEARISATWTLVELDGDGVSTLYLPAMRLTGDDFDAGDRQKESRTNMDFMLLEPAQINGKSITVRKSSTPGVDFVFSI